MDNKSSQLTLFNELRATNISNLMSLMLSWIMKAAPPPSNKSIIHTLPENVIIVTTTGLKVLNNIAIQEISLFQVCCLYILFILLILFIYRMK